MAISVRTLLIWIGLFSALPSMAQWLSAYSQTTHGTAWRGQVESRHHTMQVRIEAGYLDVTEEVELGATGSSPSGDPNSLEIVGEFRLLPGSAVTGLVIWNGDVILKGKLKPAEEANRQYEDFVDRSVVPPPRPRDPFYIRQVSANSFGNNYQYKIYPVIWGQFRRVRVRYLVPIQQGFETSEYVLPPPIFPISGSPAFKCKVESGIGTTRISFTQDAQKYTFNLPAEFDRSYYGPYPTLYLEPEYRPEWLESEIPTGEMQGHYLDFRSDLPKSVLERAGLLRETIILWKWNHPGSFFEETPEGFKSTAWGHALRDQAKSLKTIAQAAMKHHGEVGLVLHIGDRHRPSTFARGPQGSPEAERVLEVIDAVSSSGYWGELSKQLGKPRDPELDAPTPAENGYIGFHLSVKAAFSLFSPQENRLRTILIVTVGPKYSSDDPVPDRVDLGFLPSEIRLTQIPALAELQNWPGINLSRVLADHPRSRLPLTNEYGLPYTPIDSIEAEFTAGDRVFKDVTTRILREYVPYWWEKPEIPRTEFAGHATSAWSKEVRFRLFLQGQVLGPFAHTYEPTSVHQDTNFAKLWAKNPEGVSDRFPKGDLGVVFGVVDRSNSLLALDEDTASAADRETILAGGIPHLRPEEIFAPAKATTARAVAGRVKSAFILRDGWLEFHLPAFKRGTLRLITLSGRIVSMKVLRPDANLHRIPIPPGLQGHALVILLELDGKSHRFLLPPVTAR